MKRMKRNLLFIPSLFIFFVCIPFFISCENELEPDTGPINVSGIKHTGCKTFKSLVSEKQDCVEYQTVDNNYLKINRINTAFNCCIDGVLVVVTDNQTNEITIKETEICTNPCYCNCLYDLEYTLGPMEYGTYSFHVIEEYADTMSFAIEFSATTQGSYCEVRDGYPWNVE